MTLGNKLLSVISYCFNKILIHLHKVLYTEDKFHPTTKYRLGKKCINVCSYCGSDGVSKDNYIIMPESRKQLLNPIYISNMFGSNLVAYPQVTQCKRFISSITNKDIPLICDNCGKAYSSTLVVKTLDIVIILYY